MKIKSNSLLYRWLTVYGDMSCYATRIDSCSLFWRFVWAMVRTIFYAAGGTFIAFLVVVCPLIQIMAFFVEGVFAMDFPIGLGLVIWVVGVAILGIAYGIASIGMRTAKKEPGIIRQSYRAWKEKTCAIIDIVEEN